MSPPGAEQTLERSACLSTACTELSTLGGSLPFHDLSSSCGRFSVRELVGSGCVEEVGNDYVDVAEWGVAPGQNVESRVDACLLEAGGEKKSLIYVGDDAVIEFTEVVEVLSDGAVGIALCEPVIIVPGIVKRPREGAVCRGPEADALGQVGVPERWIDDLSRDFQPVGDWCFDGRWLRISVFPVTNQVSLGRPRKSSNEFRAKLLHVQVVVVTPGSDQVIV